MPIRAEHVDFSYGRRRALHSIDLELGAGTTLLLGPNGAGKSTLLEILASVRRPSSGTVVVDGVGEPGPGGAALRRYRSAVAWLPQAVTPYPGVRVREHVALSGWLKGMTRSAAWDASLSALRRVALEDRADDAVKTLSGGQTRRLGIAGALVHDARVILLDEPTANLDPAQRRRFRSILQPLAADRTVVVSSHDTEGALTAFGSVVVLVAGRVRFAGPIGDFVRAVDAGTDDAEPVELAYSRWADTIDR